MPVQPTVRPPRCALGNSSKLLAARPLATLATASASLPPAVDPRLPITTIRLDSLTNGELAIAIHAAGTLSKPQALAIDQIEALARAGIARLGLVEIRRIDNESRMINLSYCRKIREDASADVSAETESHHRIWGTWRQEQMAVDVAYRLRCALRGGGQATSDRVRPRAGDRLEHAATDPGSQPA